MIIKGHDNTQRKALQDGERGQEDKVDRVTVPLPVEKSEIDECAEHGNIERPDMVLNPSNSRAARHETSNNARSENLCEENRIDLANKRIMNLNGTFRSSHTIHEIVGQAAMVVLIINSSTRAGTGAIVPSWKKGLLGTIVGRLVRWWTRCVGGRGTCIVGHLAMDFR